MAKEIPINEQLARLSLAIKHHANEVRVALITLEDLEKNLPKDETVLALYRLSIRTIRQQMKWMSDQE